MANKKLGILSDSNPETIQGSRTFSHIILWGLALFLVIFIYWANNAVLDEVATGQGKVIPSSQIQIVQNLEGGIIKEIYVKEGQIVQRGQVLLRMDDTIFASKFNEAQKKLHTLQVELTRLNAEVHNQPLVFPEELVKEVPDLVKAQMSFYAARQTERNQMQAAITLATKELDMTEPLVQKGAVSPVEVLRLKRAVSEQEGKLYTFDSKTLERLSAAKGEYNSLAEEILSDKDRLKRTTVRSPVKGIINQLKVTTVGGVISPGMDILEIVPLDDTLLIEAHFRPQDIGFIHKGQKAMVKISAYDYSIYGGLEGIVEEISSTSIVDEHDKKQESYYEIQIRTDKNFLGKKTKPLYIIPGMQATVDILTGRKTVLDYLLKPILKAKQTALRER